MPAPRKTRRVKSARKANKATRKAVSKNMVRVFRKRTKSHKSDLEEKFLSWLKEAGLPYKWQYSIGRCHVDIFIEPNLVIEINGCYYHGHSKCQSPLTKQQKAWRLKDSKRYAFLKRNNLLMLVWGCEMDRRKDDILRRIQLYIQERVDPTCSTTPQAA